MLSGCEKDDGPAGSVEISIPGMDGNYGINKVPAIEYCGETDIKGLYATRFHCVMHSLDKPDPFNVWIVSIVMFHASPSLTPGTYTFPSTGEGTATGKINTYYSEGLGNAVSGSVSIAVSGESYTVTLNNVSANIDNETKPVSFVYKGMTEYWDWDEGDETRNPDFPGASTIRETSGGTVFPHMRMDAQYQGVSDGGEYIYSVDLTSPEIDGVVLKAEIWLRSQVRNIQGVYNNGNPYGIITLSEGANKRSQSIHHGRVAIVESDGIYSIALYDLTTRSNEAGEGSIVLNGSYMGICSSFRE